SCLWIVGGLFKSIIQLKGGLGPEGIPDLRTVESDAGHSLVFLIGNIFVFFYGLPRYCIHSVIFFMCKNSAARFLFISGRATLRRCADFLLLTAFMYVKSAPATC